MLRRNNTSAFFVFLLAGLLCTSARGAERAAKQAAADESAEVKPAAAEPAKTDIWSSIESTIQALADPFIPQVLRKDTVADTMPVVPVVPTPKPLPKPIVEKPAMIPGSTPMTPGTATVVPEVPLPVLNVSGVVFDSDMPMAVINDRVYAIGEKLSTGDKSDEVVTLKAVHAESIDVGFMGKTHTIRLK
jgi:hypothetical protein